MTNGKQIITRSIAILMICGIVLLGGYGFYKSIRDFDKSVSEVAKTDSIGRLFEINGYKYYWTFASEYSFIKRLIYTFDRVYGT